MLTWHFGTISLLSDYHIHDNQKLQYIYFVKMRSANLFAIGSKKNPERKQFTPFLKKTPWKMRGMPKRVDLIIKK
ncbi:MAG: hypothetical protein A3E80_04940 [Chlamydiae bacterium RIFCSPHIGHO2_12_FULL_49_9]|nr:MAG: hypothetical protein A3E80_04940 [Chlamydiae bacterium RIFCSPHIGHO2_12_FULL_49_9]